MFLVAMLFALQVQVFFAPEDPVEKILVERIVNETKGIRVAMFAFTNRRLAKALIDAKGRGVDVEVYVDDWSKDKDVLKELQVGGVPVTIFSTDEKGAWAPDMHHKFCLFESTKSVWTGSYNWTYKAESRNAENVVLIDDDPALYEKFFHQFPQKTISVKLEDDGKV